MSKIKLCGLTRLCDIQSANICKPDYIGFVFAPKSRRYIDPKHAEELKKELHSDILAVGVFVNEDIAKTAELLNNGVIDIVQLHGNESNEYIKKLRTLTDKPIIKAFSIKSANDIFAAQNSLADYILLDAGSGGTGTIFNWELAKNINRSYFLAGGLNLDNIKTAVETLNPYAVDVSSGIETNGFKDKVKMTEFVKIIREINERND